MHDDVLMGVVSLCFSGQPRSILTYREEWNEYFRMIRGQHELRIFFHCWSNRGLVVKAADKFIEGVYHNEIYDSFDNLIAFLKPSAFRIESSGGSYRNLIRDLGSIYITTVQPRPEFVLSQLHSIHQADVIRRDYDALHGPSDAVVKLRFDLKPHILLTHELDYVMTHPDHDVLFAPNPGWHVHPGGGGGCVVCDAFFETSRSTLRDDASVRRLPPSHPFHANDICDLYAISNSRTMRIYADAYSNIRKIYDSMKTVFKDEIANYVIEQDTVFSNVGKITGTVSGHYDLERSPAFVPEKFIRQNMRRFLVVHGRSMFVIERR